MIIRAKSPLRISFGGGGTDIPPYCDQFGGAVLSTTINKYAYVTLIPHHQPQITIKSLDFNQELTLKNPQDLQPNGQLDLIKSVIKVFQLPFSFDLYIHCDASPGSGLATSSSITVALISAFSQYMGKSLSNYDVAELAYFIERKCAGLPGGKQDQFAAAFGGFNFIEFYQDSTVVNTLRLDSNVLNELNYRLLLCDLGRNRENQSKPQKQLSQKSETQLDQLKQIAIEMKKVLLKGQLDTFGFLLHQAWLTKQQTHQQISDNRVDTLYTTAINHGAYGGKVLGAAGGGYMLLYCQFDRKPEISQALSQLNCRLIDFSFDLSGVQSWIVL
jgi:D-glycero-alpha-D-manno-heptose-7-phosphate kinase